MAAPWLLSELLVSLLQEMAAREVSPEDEPPYGHLWRRRDRLSTSYTIDYLCPRHLPGQTLSHELAPVT